jgi:hypothetical protein
MKGPGASAIAPPPPPPPVAPLPPRPPIPALQARARRWRPPAAAMNKTMGGSYHNLAALAEAQFDDARQAGQPHRGGSGGEEEGGAAGPRPMGAEAQSGSALSLDSQGGRTRQAGGGVRPRWTKARAAVAPGGRLAGGARGASEDTGQPFPP